MTAKNRAGKTKLKTQIIRVEEAGIRLDVFLAEKLPETSRSAAQKLIDKSLVTLNGRPAKSNHRTALGESIEVMLPEPEPIQIQPEEIPLDIVYEDSDFIVINKPRGMVVHPAGGHHHGTLVHALLNHCTDLSGIGGELRPGIVHRIDKDTTGLIIAAKNDFAHRSLAAQIKAHTAGRVYWALVEGKIEKNGTVSAPIGRHPTERKRMAVVSGGREAITHYRVMEQLGNYTLVECRLETGRTHQIRVHMAYLAHPVVGDPVYGHKKQHFSLEGQLLHGRELHLVHPRTQKEMSFSAPLPEDFLAVLKKLGSEIIHD